MSATLTSDPTQTTVAEQDRSLRVVMADDDRTDQLLMVMAADAAGLDADFTFADSGAQLIFQLTRLESVDELPDLILLDLNMPGLDGHRTLQELQAHPVLWQIPVVVCSSSRRPADQLRSFELGAARYETKPSEFTDLVALIERCAARARRGVYVDLPRVDEIGDGAYLDDITLGIIAELETQFGNDNDLAAYLDALEDLEPATGHGAEADE